MMCLPVGLHAFAKAHAPTHVRCIALRAAHCLRCRLRGCACCASPPCQSQCRRAHLWWCALSAHESLGPQKSMGRASKYARSARRLKRTAGILENHMTLSSDFMTQEFTVMRENP
eukprot:3588189-Prymnesium_polylepis.2